MKKTVSFILISLMLAMLVIGCAAEPASTKTDAEQIQAKGKLVVGITDFAPMDFVGENGDWVGFDADVAKLFAKDLGVSCEFTIIDWDNKTMELDAGNIDCVWNGMTLTDGVKAAMETSNPYMLNAQVIVVPKGIDENTDYTTLQFAVEAGSAAEEIAKENGWNVVSMQSQGDALLEVASGSSQACIIDRLMAGAMIGEGTSYPDLVMLKGLNEEEYGVGFRKGSDLTGKLNSFMTKLYDDGTLASIASQYGIDTGMIVR